MPLFLWGTFLQQLYRHSKRREKGSDPLLSDNPPLPEGEGTVFKEGQTPLIKC